LGRREKDKIVIVSVLLIVAVAVWRWALVKAAWGIVIEGVVVEPYQIRSIEQ
jgi:hypothetical protein